MKIQKFTEASISTSIRSTDAIEELSIRLVQICNDIDKDIEEFLNINDEIDVLFNYEKEDSGLKEDSFDQFGEKITEIIYILHDAISKCERYSRY